MKVTCNVIMDLLPLYAEDIASEDTKAIVDEHIESCPNCRKELEGMKMNTAYNMPADTDAGPLKSLRNKLFRKKIQTVCLTVLLTLTLAVIIFANMTLPEHIPYSEDVVKITRRSDGTVLAEFGENVSDYMLSSSLTDDKSGYEYSITAWNSYWTRHISRKRVQNTVLNPNGENVAAVYYYPSRGDADILIYGQSPYSGGVISLPRLVLTYYLLIAIGLAAITGLLLLLLRRNQNAKRWLIRLLFIPVSYIIGHICVKGFYTPTYTSLRDFAAILMVAFPLYLAILVARSLLEHYKQGI